MEKIPVANTYLGEEEVNAVSSVIRSGWLSMGERVKQFEHDFSHAVNSPYALATNNGTSALHLILAALGISSGDEVIVPSLTFISTANVVLYQNAKPVLVECEPNTYNIDPQSVKKAITKKTKAIIGVDMNGMPFDYDIISEICKEKDIAFIADSAESLGAEYKHKKIGSIAPIHMFSFFPNKNVTTGEGGMVTMEDEALYEKMKILRSQGQDYRYHHVALGYNYRMTELQAAIGIEQLKRLPWVIREKKNIADIYAKELSHEDFISLPYVPEYVTQHAWYMYAISVKHSRDEIVEKLAKKGIETRLSFPPIHIQPYYQKTFGCKQTDLPITYRAWSNLIDIPMWPKLGEKQKIVIKELLDIVENIKNNC